MTIILNGTTGVTFPDGTTQTDGLSTPVPVADGGTGSATAADARTALSAAKSGANSDITSITGLTTALSVAQGGTGATTLTANNVLLGNGTSALQAVAPGSSGNVLTSNGTTWTSSAPSGGVTSLNGQTGAITNTDFNSIGSYTVGQWTSSGGSQSNAGSTVAGSAINRQNTNQAPFSSYVSAGTTSAGLSGTWRFMLTVGSGSAIYGDSDFRISNILVRIS